MKDIRRSGFSPCVMPIEAAETFANGADSSSPEVN